MCSYTMEVHGREGVVPDVCLPFLAFFWHSDSKGIPGRREEYILLKMT